MKKPYCYLFFSEEELESYLKKVTTYREATAIAQSLEARFAPSCWIKKAYRKAYEIANNRA